ncbi:hypothetical protein HETIRDRAFT_243218, partial [Heterobasidion irregulare TC 32-1]
TVGQDWEESSGLIHDLFLTTVSPELKQLQERFVNEPIFREVIDALQNTDHTSSIQMRRCACHRAISYMIKDEKLWCIGNGRSPQARPCIECIPWSEAITHAARVHGQLHFGRNHVKLQLLDVICSPKLDQSIM